MKFDDDGTLLWTRSYQSTSHIASALAVDGQENVYAAGGSWGEGGTGDWDFLTLKYDPSGTLIWRKDTDARYYLSAYDGDFARGVAVDALGHVYTTGSSFNGIDSQDMLLVRYGGLPGPGEAGDEQHMTATRGSGQTVNVSYEPGCGATDHAIAWGPARSAPARPGATSCAPAARPGRRTSIRDRGARHVRLLRRRGTGCWERRLLWPGLQRTGAVGGRRAGGL